MRKLDYYKLAEDIQNWIANYVKSAGLKGVVLGLSGGIDSAVTAGLSVKALGKENVIAIGLPIESLPQDLEDAKLVADHLGIKLYIADLTDAFKEFIKVNPIEGKPDYMAVANIKPRLRMTMVYFLGQTLGGYIVGGTGNRPECAIGYFTKYGDGGVDIEPIGNLYKSEVREVARVLGIPEKIINKKASAGLWEGQTDEGEIGLSYDTIDEILYRIDNNLDYNGLNEADIEKVKKMMRAAEHKLNVPPMFEVKN